MGNEGGGTTMSEIGEINSSAKGLFRLAQLTGNSSTLAPGSCKRCGQVGHLYFNCRNYMMGKSKNDEPVEDDDPEEGEDDLEASSKGSGSDSDSDDDDSDKDDDDSDDDSDEDSTDSGKKKKGK